MRDAGKKFERNLQLRQSNVSKTYPELSQKTAGDFHVTLARNDGRSCYCKVCTDDR